MFLDLAETSGLISELGQYVLRTAIADLVVWDRDGWVSVNVAPTQLLRADVSSAVAEWCQDSGVDPHRIVLELTEGQLLEATAPVVRQLNRLRELGCQIAIDDFGSGYSSLAYLGPSTWTSSRSIRRSSPGGHCAQTLTVAVAGVVWPRRWTA